MIENISSHSNLMTTRGNEAKQIETNLNKLEINNESSPEKESSVKVKKEDYETLIKSMNDFLQPTQTSLKFQLHEKSNEYYVQVIDDASKEVVKEIPSKKLLDMYVTMKEFLGLMVDKKI